VKSILASEGTTHRPPSIMVLNPYSPNEVLDSEQTENVQNAGKLGLPWSKLARMIATAAIAVGLTLALWFFLVSLLDKRVRTREEILWAGALWFSALACTGLVASWKHACRPGIACTTAFGIFGVLYMACEGPIFGNVSQGGDPSLTQSVVWNLVCLPMGVFVAAEVGARFGRFRRSGK